MEIKINYATLETLIKFYNENKYSFNPPLDLQVNSIEEYVAKLKNKAIIFEAWGGELMGLVAVYMNNCETKIAFISSVLVSAEYQRKGIAEMLLKSVIEAAISKEFVKIELEVYKTNIKAINLYKKFGFEEIFREGLLTNEHNGVGITFMKMDIEGAEHTPCAQRHN